MKLLEELRWVWDVSKRRPLEAIGTLAIVAGFPVLSAITEYKRPHYENYPITAQVERIDFVRQNPGIENAIQIAAGGAGVFSGGRVEQKIDLSQEVAITARVTEPNPYHQGEYLLVVKKMPGDPIPPASLIGYIHEGDTIQFRGDRFGGGARKRVDAIYPQEIIRR